MRSARSQIVVIGGYGAVGRVVARTLGGWFPGQTVVAGRDLGRAEATARSLPGAVTAQRLDVARADDLQPALAGARVVVMCVERANEAVARACLASGVQYVDVSASTSVLASIARLHELGLRERATAAISVGLVPGLSNLLARACLERLPGARTVEITLLVGLGDHGGADAMRWTVDNLIRPADRRGAERGPVRVSLPGVGLRTAYPFPFSDQYTLRETLGVTATTRLCFDPAPLTRIVFGLRAAGLFSLLGRLGAADLLARGLARIHLGGDRYALRVSASDGASTVAWTAAGRRESSATGIVAAHVARRLYAGHAPAGVFHIEQLIEPAAFLGQLADHQIAVTSTE